MNLHTKRRRRSRRVARGKRSTKMRMSRENKRRERERDDRALLSMSYFFVRCVTEITLKTEQMKREGERNLQMGEEKRQSDSY